MMEGKAEGEAPANGVKEDPGLALSPIKSQRDSVVDKDPEVAEKKLKYPKVVFFIIGNEFCERFTYYGMRTVLSLYLKNSLMLDESTATIIYHLFAMLSYFFPLLGGIIADSWLGKFRTIAYLSMVYALGNIVLSVASATGLGLPSVPMTYIGLLLIAIGTGGIKPCVSSFGGEQFIIPQQELQLAAFFSVFYFSINAGSLISTSLTPELRTIACLGDDTCYPLAFGVPSILMIVAIIIFMVGKPGYRVTEPKGNVLVEVSKCMGNAIKNKIRSKGEKKGDWLDYADSKYSNKLREDIRLLLRVLLLFVPLPIFWALYEQQGSKWTFQANNMNGRMGSIVIKPDQMQVVNPVLIMILLPLFEAVIYPVLRKFGIMRKPLQKMAVGGMLAAVAFVISALVQQQLDPYIPVETSAGLGQVRVFSTLPCNVTISGKGGTNNQQVSPYNLEPQGFWEKVDFEASGETRFDLNVKGSCVEGSLALTISEEKSVSYHLFTDNSSPLPLKYAGPYVDDLNKDAIVKTRLMYHFADDSVQHTVKFVADNEEKHSETVNGTNAFKLQEDLFPAEYTVYVDEQEIDTLFLDIGGFYNILFTDVSIQSKVLGATKVSGKIGTVITPNTLNLLWQLPQYLVISVAEVMFSVTGYEFSFTQAPNSMKSVVSSMYLLTDAIGNVIIILIESVKIFPRQAEEIYLFAGLMVADMLLFIWLAVRYKPQTPPSEEDEENENVAPSETSTASADDRR